MTVTRWTLALALAAVAQTGLADEQDYEVGAFRAIEAQRGTVVNVAIAQDYSVSARTDDDDLGKFRVREFLPWMVFDSNSRWFIFPKWRDDVFTVSVETPVLNGLKAFEGAQANFGGNAGERLWIETGTGGLITLTDIEVDDLTLVAREGGSISADGTCDQLTIRNQGVLVDATGLSCASVVVNGDPTGVVLAPGVIVVQAHPDPES